MSDYFSSPSTDGHSRAEAYRRRAEELRTIAEDIRDANCRATLLRLAISYEDMARSAERTAE